MERFTISLDSELAKEFDALIAERGYRTRSEAVRDLLRAQLEQWRQAQDAAPHCVANLSYIYNHHERELAERLMAVQHAHHDLTVSTLHAHLDHENCIESILLRGPTAEVRRFAEALMAERGVRHGKLNLIAVEIDHSHDQRHRPSHAHGYKPPGHGSSSGHVHFKPAR
jgi:CopG family transcriptional regulator, nickel-responsive regulator